MIEAINDFVIRFANVNGTGSASANNMFAKAIFRSGIPVSPKNIFPSNIQGLPTWYEVRVSEKGHLGRRGGVDFLVAFNAQSMQADYREVLPGGYFMYDSSKPLPTSYDRDDIQHIGIPATRLSLSIEDMRKRQLLSNMIGLGALVALLNMEIDVLNQLVQEQFKGKDALIQANVEVMQQGYDYACEHHDCPIGLKVERRDLIGDSILMQGNDALGLGAIYAGTTVVAWYPITPSTSVAEAYERYARELRVDEQGNKKYAIVQAEDELAALGMVLGASWNGARAFTATSGPGISLMNEFLGLAYFAEVPAVLVNVQRVGPSTGMPTRTQQGDLLLSAYASHGDTRHILLFPSTPNDCFEMINQAFDLAEVLQTPVILMSDLDLGMNESVSSPLQWDDLGSYNRGKVLSVDQLEAMQERYGRYLDTDGDGIPYRTLPGMHPTKGSFFTRGSSRNRYAVYTEQGHHYVDNMDRLLHKWDTAKPMMPKAVLEHGSGDASVGVLCYGTSLPPTLEAVQTLSDQDIDVLRIRAFPFDEEVQAFISAHKVVFLVEQNRDAQMRTLLVNELSVNPASIQPILHYDGMPITAEYIHTSIGNYFSGVGSSVAAGGT